MAIAMVVALAGCGQKAPAANSAAPSAAAATLPKTASVYVGAKAGGVSDLMARAMTTYLQSSAKVNFAVVNQDAATANQSVLAAAKDGTGLFVNHSGIIVNYLSGAIDFDPREKLTVICEFGDLGDQALIVPKNAPYSDMKGFVEYCKAHPNEVSAAIQTGGMSQLVMGLVSKECGIQLKYVECASEADKLTNVSGGFIGIANCSLSNAKQYEDSGMLKVIATVGSSPNDNPSYPKWKSVANQGYKVTINGSMFLFGPAGMSDSLCNAINTALKNMVNDENAKKTLSGLGGSVQWYDLATSRAHFNKAVDDFKAIADSVGMTKKK